MGRLFLRMPCLRRIAGMLPAFCAWLCLMGMVPAYAQTDYPTRPIRVIVPYTPGGIDQQLRLMLPTLQRMLGQRLEIEHMPGAGGGLGAARVKNAPADGYTLLYTGAGTLTALPALNRRTPYTVADFTPVGNVIGTPFVVAARADAPFKTMAELVAYAKANPGKMKYASPGNGTGGHLAAEAISGSARIRIVHMPYQGVGPAVNAVLAGAADMMIGLPNVVMPQVNAGRLLALGTTAPQRNELMPNVPTMREAGIDVVDVTRFGLFAPRGTPEPVLKRLTAAVAEAVRMPEFAEAMTRSYNTVAYLDPVQFRAALDADSLYFSRLVRELRLGEP